MFLDNRRTVGDFVNREQRIDLVPFSGQQCYSVLGLDVQDPARRRPGDRIGFIIEENYIKLHNICKTYGRCNLEGRVIESRQCVKYDRHCIEGVIMLDVKKNSKIKF